MSKLRAHIKRQSKKHANNFSMPKYKQTPTRAQRAVAKAAGVSPRQLMSNMSIKTSTTKGRGEEKTGS